MALEDLNPAVRVEEILDGGDIEPATRLEYFMKKAANEVPKPAGSSDSGKVVTVNEDGDGYELGEIPSGLPEYTSADKGKVLTIGEGEGGETVVIVPEQTVTLTDEMGAVSTSAEQYSMFTALTESDSVSISVDGVEYAATIRIYENPVAVYIGETFAYNFAILDNALSFTAVDTSGGGEPSPMTGTYTVSLTRSVPSVEPKWGAVSGVLILSEGNHGYLDGSAQDVMNALESGKLVVVRKLILGDVSLLYFASISGGLTQVTTVTFLDAVHFASVTYTASSPTDPLVRTSN